jgi:hypothetical protein
VSLGEHLRCRRHRQTQKYGTFTIQMGNTTWSINDVCFDTPDAGRIPAMEIKPLTSASVARQA